MSRAFGSLLVMLAAAMLLAAAGQASAQGELHQASAVSISVAVGEPTGTANRLVTVTASGVAAQPGTHLYVGWDHRREPCPRSVDDLPAEGGWALYDEVADLEYKLVGPGPFSETDAFLVPPGFLRLCAYLDDSFGLSYAVAREVLRIPVDPDAPLNRAAVIDIILNSPRVHRDVKAWIRRGESENELGLGINGPGYLRFADLTGDGLSEGVVMPSAGGAGRVHAYYIVTTQGGAVRVAAAVRRGFNVVIQRRGRGYREIIPRYAARDAFCCASRRSVRLMRWNGRRFVQASRRVVKTRFYRPPVRRVAQPARPAPSPAPRPATPSCDPNYSGACIPVVPYDLDCGDVSAVNFGSVGSDPHRFDGDGDGIACES